jgi:hypothetical protein
MIDSLPLDAATSVWAAVVALADEVGGQYCENCHIGKIVPDDVTITVVSEGVRSYALDPNNAEALWKKREEMVGELLLKDYGKSAVMPESRATLPLSDCGRVADYPPGAHSFASRVPLLSGVPGSVNATCP